MATIEASGVLDDINRDFRQHGLATVVAKPLSDVIAENNVVLLPHAALKDLQLSLKQLLADNEHSRKINQQLLLELQDSRSELLAEKQRTTNLTAEARELKRLRAEAQAAADELRVSKLAELHRHGREVEEAKESRDCAWAQVGVLRTENESLKQSVDGLQQSMAIIQSQRRSSTEGRRSSSSSDAPKGHTQTLGLLSSSRDCVHQLQADINCLRQQMQDYKEGRSSQSSSPTAEHKLAPRPTMVHVTPDTLNSPTLPDAHSHQQQPDQTNHPVFAERLEPVGRDLNTATGSSAAAGAAAAAAAARVSRAKSAQARQWAVDSCSDGGGGGENVDARVLDTESPGDHNSTFDTDNSAWEAMGLKVERLTSAKEELEEQLQRCAEQLEQALIERKCLLGVCSQLSVVSYEEIPAELQKLLLAVRALPSLEKFFNQVISLVPRPRSEFSSASCHADSGGEHSCSEDQCNRLQHADWCETLWEHVMPTLSVWQKSMDEASRNMKVSRRRYHAMRTCIKHVQSLFDVKDLSGLVPTMSTVYSRLSESETLKKSLRNLLGLDQKASIAKILQALQLLTEGDTNHSLLTVSSDRDRLRTQVAESTELLLSFRGLMQELLAAAGVDVPSKLTDAVRQLKEHQARTAG